MTTEIRPAQSSPHPYIPNTLADQQAMLATIGVGSIEELFEDIPESIRNPELDLPDPFDEKDLKDHMMALAARNIVGIPCFLGYGSYRRYQPAIVSDITGRDENLTKYTPYQAEISQGNLEASYVYQTMMCILYDMDVSNTGMYDGATAMAEAALMAVRIKGRGRIVALDTVHPNWLEVTRTYLSGQETQLDLVNGEDDIDQYLDDASALIVQSPNYLGSIEDLRKLGEKAKEADALFIVVADPISLGMLKPPGEFGADIAVGEGQSLGNPTHLGGVNLGIFTAKGEYVRQMPGRIVGKAFDQQGRAGYVLTLQTREQHIRRERATSNICTAEQLVALASTVYLSALGPEGLRELAEMNYHLAHYTAEKITSLTGFRLALEKDFFNEFVIECPIAPAEVNKRLLQEGIIGGKDVSDRIPRGMLLCVTEMNSKEEIDYLVEVLAKIGGLNYAS